MMTARSWQVGQWQGRVCGRLVRNSELIMACGDGQGPEAPTKASQNTGVCRLEGGRGL